MKKWLYIVGGLLVIVVAVVIFGLSKLGPIIKNAVNTYGPKITKTDVRLDDVGISILSGEAKLKNLYLGNPKGFKSPQAMRVKSVYVDVDEKSITGDTIIIDKVEVVGPEITYEKTGRTDNFKTILNNVKSGARASKSSKNQAAKEGEGKKLMIRNFIIKDGEVDLNMSVYGGSSLSASASLPDIHLKDVGKKKGGATPEEVFNIVFAELYKRITSPAVTTELNKQAKALASQALEGGKVGKEEVGKAAGDTVKSLFGK